METDNVVKNRFESRKALIVFPPEGVLLGDCRMISAVFEDLFTPTAVINVTVFIVPRYFLKIKKSGEKMCSCFNFLLCVCALADSLFS